jgi:hypothetical protein
MLAGALTVYDMTCNLSTGGELGLGAYTARNLFVSGHSAIDSIPQRHLSSNNFCT